MLAAARLRLGPAVLARGRAEPPEPHSPAYVGCDPLLHHLGSGDGREACQVKLRQSTRSG